jgi:organic hydroperoxide reductase OsmC/OhrA
MTTPPVTIRNYSISAQSTDVFGRVLVSARDHHFVVDGPVQNGCPGEEVTPPELFLSSVAACGVELVHVIARETGKTVGKVSLAVHGTVDRGNQKRPGVTVFNAVRMEFSVGGTDGATAAELVEAFKRR